MRKVFVLIALFASMAVAHAQFGFIGGLTVSDMQGANNVKDVKSKTLYHAGILLKMDLGAGFAVQPTMTYSVKGSTVHEDFDALDNVFESKTGYVELGFGAQWGPDLLAFRPYLFVEPFLGYGVTGKEQSERIEEAKNKLEYGLGAGLGLEVASHVQLSCQVFRNMGPLYQQDKVSAPLNHVKSYQGVKLSLAILF
jgi:hypothetical protein